MNELSGILAEIRRISNAERLVVYGVKREGERVRDVDVCVIADTADKDALAHRLYLEIDSDISFDVLIYTPQEWSALLADPQSYASRIAEKGQAYGEA